MNNSLPDFARVVWHSAHAKEVWAPRLEVVNRAWMDIERWSVVDGVRDAYLTMLTPEQLADSAIWAASHGISTLPLLRVGVTNQYSATSKALSAGQPWQYRVVYTRAEHLSKWLVGWQGDNMLMGELLGYPRCCREFFEREWVRAGSVDTSWAMALNTPNAVDEGGNRIVVNGPMASNILLRWLGVRLVPHLPCSFACDATVKLGRSLIASGRNHKLDEQIDWLEEMLTWPVEWSAVHGIAEIRTPILTISARTNHTLGRYVVQHPGTEYPEAGAQGLRFPYRIVRDKTTASPSFRRSVESTARLNGFETDALMDQAHNALLSVLPTTPGSVLDLGCGTGRLLERMQALGWTVTGVESDNMRAGASRLPVRRGNIFDLSVWDGAWDTVLVMPGRLLEVSAGADQFRQALHLRARTVLLYAYGDWLKKFGGLGPLAAEAGLGSGDVLKTASADGVEAALVQFGAAC